LPGGEDFIFLLPGFVIFDTFYIQCNCLNNIKCPVTILIEKDMPSYRAKIDQKLPEENIPIQSYKAIKGIFSMCKWK